MANTIITMSAIAKEALRTLTNNMPMMGKVSKKYESMFAQKGAKVGDSVSVKKANEFQVRSGLTMSAIDQTEETVSVTMDKVRGVDMDFTDLDLTLHVDDFSDQFIKPAVTRLANYLEDDLHASVYKKFHNYAGTPGTTPATFASLSLTAKAMQDALVPLDGRNHLVIDTAANQALVDGMKGFFNPSPVISNQFGSGIIGNSIAGFDTISMSQVVNDHTVGAYAGTPLMNGATASGATSIVTDGWTSGSSDLKEGDILTIAGVFAVNPQTKRTLKTLHRFTVTADISDTAGAKTIAISPAIVSTGNRQNVSALPANDAAIVVLGTASAVYAQNLAFNTDAISFVSADLPMPKNKDVAVANANGISVRVARDWDIATATNPCRIDVLYGIDVVQPEFGVRLFGN